MPFCYLVHTESMSFVLALAAKYQVRTHCIFGRQGQLHLKKYPVRLHANKSFKHNFSTSSRMNETKCVKPQDDAAYRVHTAFPVETVREGT